MKTSERNGSVVGVVQVKETDGVMVITNQGMLIRLAAKGISVIGRNTQGVRLISLESADEKVVGVVRVVADETPEGGEPPPEDGGSDTGSNGEPGPDSSNGSGGPSDGSSGGEPSASGDG
jgi:DNA gyrase subunit A